MGNPSKNSNDANDPNETNNLRVALEIGLRGKRVVAVAPDWPGLERGATAEEAAIERLLSYIPRYAPVAELAGMETASFVIRSSRNWTSQRRSGCLHLGRRC